MADRILVTGGTGTTGRRVAAGLVRLGRETVVATRRPKSEQERRLDWADPTSAEAFAGCGAAYLVAPTDRIDHIEVMRPILERAMAAGTRRFVLLSSSLLEPGAPMMGAVHAWLAANAPEWTVLRPSWFMQNFSDGPHAGSIREDGAIYSATGDGRVGFISADDIAEAAVAALISESSPNSDFVLTGPEALGYSEVAAIVSALLPGTVRHIDLAPEALAQRFVAQGLGEPYARTLADLDGAIRAGAEDRTTGCVRQLTGHDPVSFRAFAAGAVAAWRRAGLEE